MKYFFDKVEVKFNLNQEGEPEGVYFKSKDANHMIEEFMLLANKKSG
jgi:ribonuclease R